eukprot:20540-Eustigmatos_ZCMA.PRE.1
MEVCRVTRAAFVPQSLLIVLELSPQSFAPSDRDLRLYSPECQNSSSVRCQLFCDYYCIVMDSHRRQLFIYDPCRAASSLCTASIRIQVSCLHLSVAAPGYLPVRARMCDKTDMHL